MSVGIKSSLSHFYVTIQIIIILLTCVKCLNIIECQSHFSLIVEASTSSKYHQALFEHTQTMTIPLLRIINSFLSDVLKLLSYPVILLISQHSSVIECISSISSKYVYFLAYSTHFSTFTRLGTSSFDLLSFPKSLNQLFKHGLLLQLL